MPAGCIAIQNNSQDNVRVAVFKKSIKQATLGTIAWRVVAPPKGGHTKVMLPDQYEVFINYPGPSDDKTDPCAGNQTEKIVLTGYTGRFIVNSSKTVDGHSVTAALTQTFQNLVPEEVYIVNQSGFGVWGHIQKDGKEIFPPQVITPGSELMEDLRPTYYLAIVENLVKEGDRLLEREISTTLTEIRADSTAVVSGSQWDGYSIVIENVCPPSPC